MDFLWQDLKHAARTMRKNPGFTAVVVLTMALGIGVNTALFSVVNGVLLNPLPYPHPEQLVTLHESKPNFETGSISYPNFRDWQRDNYSFSAIAVSRGYDFSLTGAGEAEQVDARFVSSDFFPLLGVMPEAGRLFAPGEDEIGATPLAMISAGLWKRKFASSPDVLGKGITLDGKAYNIVGVIPANFELLLRSFRVADVYVPIGQWDNPFLANRGAGLGIHGIGRLKPGVTIERAQADMDGVSRNLAAAYPDDDNGIGAKLIPLRVDMLGKTQPILLVLLGAVGFLLLIACVNVANLLLARSTARAREFAIRAALGARQTRLVRLLLTESVLLALAGGALGLLFATWIVEAALGALPQELPRAHEIGMDTHVQLFTLGVSLFAGVLFGLVPALKTSQPDLHHSLKEGGRGASGRRQRTQGTFVLVEMALTVVLLIGAGLMVRSLAALWNVNPGFTAHNVLNFDFSFFPSMRNANAAAVRATLREVNHVLESIPGVRAQTLSWGAEPLLGDDEDLFWIDGQPKPTTKNDMNWSLSHVVQEKYLQVMGIPLLRGRFFTPQDNEQTQHVIVVDDVFARRYFGGQDPIGKRIHLDNKGGLAEIVGVVGHVKQWGLDTEDSQALRAELYFPYMQLPDEAVVLARGGTGGFVRFDGSAAETTEAIRAALRRMNGEQVIYNVRTMEEVISRTLAARRFSMLVLAVFAGLALALSSAGIYGVISYLAGQRTHKIGVRMALGAQRSDVLQLVLGQGAKMAVVGIVIGLGAAVGLTRLVANQLFHVSATDPLTFAAVAILLLGVSQAACYLPARRATRVDPLVALRYE
jgi:predicted permease